MFLSFTFACRAAAERSHTFPTCILETALTRLKAITLHSCSNAKMSCRCSFAAPGDSLASSVAGHTARGIRLVADWAPFADCKHATGHHANYKVLSMPRHIASR